MPHLRFDWHEHIKEVEAEYRAARFGMDQLKQELARDPGLLKRVDSRADFRKADANLEGTYLVRIFAAFEAALRSYDRAKHQDPNRIIEAAVLIDTIGGRRGQGISKSIRDGAHFVRRARNYWAHEDNAIMETVAIPAARAKLQTFLSWLPEQWG